MLGVLYGGLRKAVGLWGVGRAEFVGDPVAFAECVEFGQELGTRIVSGQPRVLNHLTKVFVSAAVFVLLSSSAHRYPE